MGSSVSLKPWRLLSLQEQQAVLGLCVTSQQAEFAGTVERSVESCRSESARRAYAKAGFIDHGTREQGRIGSVRHMSRPVGGGA